jgi:hypothetical protein
VRGRWCSAGTPCERRIRAFDQEFGGRQACCGLVGGLSGRRPIDPRRQGCEYGVDILRRGSRKVGFGRSVERPPMRQLPRSSRTVPPAGREGAGSANLPADEHIALPERANDRKPFPLEHADRPEPGRHGSPVRCRVRFHDAAPAPPDRLEGRVERNPSYAGPTKRPVDEEAGDPPARGRAEVAGQRLVLTTAFDSRQLRPPSELTPSDRLAVSVHQDPVSVTSQYERAMVSTVRLLTALALKGSGRALAMIEHAPATGLHTVVLSEQSLEIRPRGGRELAHFEWWQAPRSRQIGGHSGSSSKPKKVRPSPS